jgi:type I restriction enzyme, S subunit
MTASETWRVRHLGTLKNGAGFPVDLQGDPSKDIAFFKVKHLNVHGLGASMQNAEDTVSQETARALRATIFPPRTIVFAKIGAALLLGRFSMLGRKACIDNNMAAFIPY